MEWNARNILNPNWPDARFHIAGLFEIEFFMLEFIEDLNAKVSCSPPIESVFGSLACKWNGGRVINPQINKNWIEKLKAWKALDYVNIYYTFNSATLDNSCYDDTLCNKMLDVLYENYGGRSGVTLVDDGLADYIRKKYPYINQKASIVKSATERPFGRTVEYYKDLASRFEMVVLHPDDVFKSEILEDLATSPEKYEIMINEKCVKDCHNRKEHYMAQSMNFLNNRHQVPMESIFDKNLHPSFCKGIGLKIQNGTFERSCVLTTGEIKKLYDMGFRNFKIEGRSLSAMIKNAIKKYMFNQDFIDKYSILWQSVELKYNLGL